MKRKMTKKKFNLSIRTKLLLLSSVIVLATLLFLLLAYHFWFDFAYQERLFSFNAMNRQLVQTIEANIEQRQIIVRTLCESENVQELLLCDDRAATRRIYKEDVEPIMEALTESAQSGQMLWLIRYDNSGYEDIHIDYEGVSSGIKTNSLDIENGTKDYAVFNQSRISKQKWFQALKGNLKEYRIQRTNLDYLNHCFSIVAEVKKDGYSIGMVRLISSLQDFIGKEEEYMSTQDGNVFVFDEDFFLLSTKKWKKTFVAEHVMLFERCEKALESGGVYQEIIEDWVVSAGELGETGFFQVIVTPAELLMEKSNRLQLVLITCIFAIAVLVSAFTFGVSRYLTKRLQRLSEAMRLFGEGEKNVQLEVQRNDEISALYAGYNHMTENISMLMRKNIEIAKEKEKAELQMLQMQINPHFLYNSLSTILRLVDANRVDLIKKLVFSLTDFYRLSLNRGMQAYTVADEIKQIQSYLSIFTIRKGESFSSEIKMTQEAKNCGIIKLILQPFVENIFQHAFDALHTFVHIRITQSIRDGMLVFRIEDNGCGMDKETLHALRKRTYKGGDNGFGICNVLSRLELFYTSHYRFSIESEVGKGTVVEIELPTLCDAD